MVTRVELPIIYMDDADVDVVLHGNFFLRVDGVFPHVFLDLFDDQVEL